MVALTRRRVSRACCRLSSLALAALALAAVAGCQEQAGAEVELSWAFGPDQLGCDAAGVKTVHVFVGPLAPSGDYDHEVRCEVGESSLRLRGVSPEHHVLVLKGLASDKVLYTLTQEIDVSGGALGHFVLDPYAAP